jgi:hypothetical protein
MVAAVILLPINASAIVVGTNADVHFDFEGAIANDFHVEGLIHSVEGEPPSVVEVFVFGDGSGIWKVTGYCLYQPDPIGAPDDWWFTADFKTDGFIKFCDMIHFGLMFDVTCYNVMVDLHGWWTLDGQRLFPPKASASGGVFDSDVAVTGFHVDDIGRIREGKQTLRITNDTDIMIEVPIIEVAIGHEVAPLQDMNEEHIGGAGTGPSPDSRYANLEWIHVPISNPVLEPGAYFDVPLESIGIHIGSAEIFHIRGITMGDASAPNGVLRVPEKEAQGKSTWTFFWDQHEAHY